jgi:hypothetical protein
LPIPMRRGSLPSLITPNQWEVHVLGVGRGHPESHDDADENSPACRMFDSCQGQTKGTTCRSLSRAGAPEQASPASSVRSRARLGRGETGRFPSAFLAAPPGPQSRGRNLCGGQDVNSTGRYRGFRSDWGSGFSSSSAASTACCTASAALSAVTAKSLVIPAASCTIPPRIRRPPRRASRTASPSWDS